MKICFVLGTRPEIIKLSPLISCFKNNNIKTCIIHTGQHKLFSMEKVFFQDFKIKPNYVLKNEQNFVANTINDLCKIYLKEMPNYIINQGDTNTVLASSLAHNILKNTKLKNTKLVHVEAGLRSFDKSMPEEMNRIISDQLSDFLFAPTKISKRNLYQENINHKKIYVVGNTISDALNLSKKKIGDAILKKLHIKKKSYFLLTLHRPDLVDKKKNLTKIIKHFSKLSKIYNLDVIFPIHPRTYEKMKKFDLLKLNKIKFIDPCNYFDFLSLQKNAKIVLTDSGGIQEETTILKTPCITIRKNTERPETIKAKTNILTNYSLNKINNAIQKSLNKKILWKNIYGKNVSNKIFKIIKKDYEKNKK